MKPYYTRAALNPNRISKTIKSSKDAHWLAYDALLQGYPESWRPDILKRLQHAVAEKNVQVLFMIIDELDALLTQYDASTDLQVVRLDRQAACFLKKYPFSDNENPFDPRANAIESWESAEQQCKLTNERLTKELEDKTSDTFILLERMRLIILRVLGGDLSPSTLIKYLGEGRHGPGSTLTNSFGSGMVTEFYKFRDLPYSVSTTGLPYLKCAITLDHRWLDYLESSGRRSKIPLTKRELGWRALSTSQSDLCDDCVVIHDVERLAFVPKNARTFRAIGVGCTGNMYCQLGINSFLTECLMEVGVNLLDQTKNKSLAQQGSEFCFLADGTLNKNQWSTADIRSASDTVAIALCRFVLPPFLYAVLDDLRMKAVDHNGHWILNKFMAMGNGTTFPLESLLFWAASQAAQEVFCDTPVGQAFTSVFGDDVIVRHHSYDKVAYALGLCGFVINQEKSFKEGPFKESCGGDYFLGKHVRPFYLRANLGDINDIYSICNRLSSGIMLGELHGACSGLYRFLVGIIPVDRRTFGPLDLSDTILQVPLDYMRQIGLNPYLDQSDRRKMIRRYMSNDAIESKALIRQLRAISASWLTPIYFDRNIVAKRFYKDSKENTRLVFNIVLRHQAEPLRQTYGFYTDPNQWLYETASEKGQVTRKGRLTQKLSLCTCPNWDARYTKQQLMRHPAWGEVLEW